MVTIAAILLPLTVLGGEYTHTLDKTTTGPFIAEYAELGQEFEFFLAKDSSVRYGENKNWQLMTFEKLEVKSVYKGKERIGQQFYFYFKVQSGKKTQSIKFIVDEPQNMDLDQHRLKRQYVAEAFGFKIEYMDMLFGISKNAISLKITKIEQPPKN